MIEVLPCIDVNQIVLWVDGGKRMTNGAAAKASIRTRAADELKEFLIIAAYLYVCFTALAYFKAAILQAHGILRAIWYRCYQGFDLRQVHERGSRYSPR